MLIRLPLTKPARVRFAFFAMSNPESKAAPSEDTIGIPTFAALKIISPDKRPVEAKNNLPNSISLYGSDSYHFVNSIMSSYILGYSYL